MKNHSDRKRPAKRRVRRWIFITAAGSIAAVLSLILVLQITSVRLFAWNRMVQYLEDQYGVIIEVSGVRFNLARLRFDLGDPQFRAARTSGSDSSPERIPFFEADRLLVDVSVGDLVRGTLVIQEVIAENAGIRVRIDENGDGNLPDLAMAESEPGGPV
jgi:hypothetical protein